MATTTTPQTVQTVQSLTDAANAAVGAILLKLAADVALLTNSEAYARVAGVLGSAPATATPAAAPAAAPAAKAAKKPAAKKATAKKAAKAGEKRTPEKLAADVETVFAFIQANPASGAEAISKGTGLDNSAMSLPIKKLLADKKVAKKGQKRATTYTAR